MRFEFILLSKAAESRSRRRQHVDRALLQRRPPEGVKRAEDGSSDGGQAARAVWALVTLGGEALDLPPPASPDGGTSA